MRWDDGVLHEYTVAELGAFEITFGMVPSATWLVWHGWIGFVEVHRGYN